MEYKRIEIYVWWTCNQKCTYCMEFPNMERQWTKRVTKYEILKYLIKYKKQWYNHVTLLWWEPFIQAVFLDALKLWKKMGYTILVTTNATTLHLEKEAEKYLPYIDELILSVQAIDIDLQQKISRTDVFVKWEEVFNNIKKYWKWSYFKANIVITKDNLPELYDLVKYVHSKWMKEISITYPDLDLTYYWKKHLKDSVAPTYEESIKEVIKIDNYCDENNIHLKIVDFPFCVFPQDKMDNYINKTDDFDYWNRLKVGTSLFEDDRPESKVIDRSKIIPRERRHIEKCRECKYTDICWWPAVNYKTLYWYNEINTIKNEQ